MPQAGASVPAFFFAGTPAKRSLGRAGNVAKGAPQVRPTRTVKSPACWTSSCKLCAPHARGGRRGDTVASCDSIPMCAASCAPHGRRDRGYRSSDTKKGPALLLRHLSAIIRQGPTGGWAWPTILADGCAPQKHPGRPVGGTGLGRGSERSEALAMAPSPVMG